MSGTGQDDITGTGPTPEAAEVERLRRALADEQKKRFLAEAGEFASARLVAGKIVPVEQEALKAVYVLAATDDAEHGTVTRVAALTALMDARPANILTTEQVEHLDDSTVLQNNTVSEDDEVKSARANARRFASKRNGKTAAKEA